MLLNFIKKNKLLTLVIFLVFTYHLLISFPSGSYYCFNKKCGLYFWGAYEHDGIWHLAIAETSFKTWPPQHPTFAGEKLTGYNYFLDLIIFLLSKTGIPSIVWYFKILPLVWIILMIFLIIKISQRLKKDYFYQVFLLFFIFFGSSFGYFFTLYHKKTLIGSSSSLAMQAGLTLVNLQFAYSLIFLILLLIVLLKKQKTLKETLLIGFLNFLILSLKFYGGVISLFLSVFYLFFENFKKFSLGQFFILIKNFLIIIFFLLVSIFVFYQPFQNKSNTGFIFSPFSIVHSIIEEKNLFYLPKLVNARYYLYSVNPLSPRLLAIELFTAFLFLFFNLGTRFLGLVDFLIRGIKRKVNLFEITLFLGTIFSFSLSLLFIQKGIWWNTIQFSYYGLFLANFFIADFLSKILKKKKNFFALVTVFLIIILTLPENYDIIRGFIPNPNASYIPKEELEALIFLRKQKGSIVLSSVNKKERKITNNFRTAFISAFSKKISYLSNETQLIVTGINFDERIKKIQEGNCLVLKNVDFIYINDKNDNLITLFKHCQQNKKIIYQNKNISIFLIKK